MPCDNKPGNNLRHGFRSSAVLLPGDDPSEYRALQVKLNRHFGPTDLTEDRLVREMTDAEYRLRRCRVHIQSAVTRHMATVAAANPTLTGPGNEIALQSKAIETLAETGCSYATWLRYESKFEHQYDRAYRTWARYQQDRRRLSARQTDVAMKKAIAGGPLILPAAPPPSERAAGGQLIPPNPARGGQPLANVQSLTGQQHTAPVPVPRSAPCTCGSGRKYKRCCGISAPAVLSRAA